MPARGVTEPTFLDRARETAPAEQLRTWQWERVEAGLREIWTGNLFWRARLQGAGIRDPRDVASWDDFARLPRLAKGELAADQDAHPPFGTNLTYPLERYVRVFQTSGTTGPPIRWLETEDSWAWWARCWAFVFRAAGLGPADRIAFPFSFGLFVGFWAGLEGARALGALAIPGAARTRRRGFTACASWARRPSCARRPTRSTWRRWRRARGSTRPRGHPDHGPRRRAGGGDPGRPPAARDRGAPGCTTTPA